MMNDLELIKKEFGNNIFPIALSSVRRLMKKARQDAINKAIKLLENELEKDCDCESCILYRKMIKELKNDGK